MMFNVRQPVIKSNNQNQRVANIITLITTCFASALDILNLSAVNIALPSIVVDLDLDTSTTPWLIASYAVSFAAFLLPAGKFGDLYGYRIIYLAGIIIFLVASVVNGISPNKYVLFVFRAIQGLGAACTIPNAIALVANSYEDERPRRIALSVFGGSGPIGLTLGLILGGALSFTIGWRWIFYISAIFSFIMFILAFLYVPDFRHEGSAEKVDMLGFFLAISGFTLFIYALSDGQWYLARDPVTLVIGVILIAVFMVWQLKSSFPLIRPIWWRRQNFTGAFTVSFLRYAAFSGYIYITTLLFQDAYGYSPLQSALYYLPMGIVAFFMANSMGYITPYVGARIVMIIGSLLALSANVGLLYYSNDIGFWKLIFPMHIIMGLALPMLYVAGQNAMIATAPPSETGTLGAVYSASGQLGSAVGTALMTAVINGVNNGVTDITGLPGYHAAFYVNIGLLGISAITSALFIQNEHKSKENSEITVSTSNASEKTAQDLEKGTFIDEEKQAKEVDIITNDAIIVVSP
ncbi:major facilitator superfamily domain-containing protein [Umbelopsis sp. PMI_123]|nr:major facilitator superfamily domain-containing protein [Umbelopsis sp. PMI_123]